MKFILLLICCTLVQTQNVSPDDIRRGLVARQQLFKNITANRDASTIPTIKGSPISVTVGLDISKIMDYNKEEGTITLSGWFSYMWNDPLLKWNPSEHSGIEKINVPSRYIWSPDILPFGASLNADPEGEYQKVIFATGKVLYVPQATITAYCQKMINNEVKCNNSYGSWTFDDSFITLTMGSLNLYDDPARMAKYKVEKLSGDVETKVYPCCPNEGYPKLNVYYTVRPNTYDRTFWSTSLPSWLIMTFLIPFFLLIPGHKSARIIIIGINICILFVAGSSMNDDVLTEQFLGTDLSYFFRGVLGLNILALSWSLVAMFILTNGYQVIKNRLMHSDAHKVEENKDEHVVTFNDSCTKVRFGDLIIGGIIFLVIIIMMFVHYSIMP